MTQQFDKWMKPNDIMRFVIDSKSLISLLIL
jgi:hypothetical protein